MCEECTVIGYDLGRPDVSIEVTWGRGSDGTWMVVGWKATNHGSEAVTVVPPVALQPPEIKP